MLSSNEESCRRSDDPSTAPPPLNGTRAIAVASRAIFDMIDPAAYYTRPIALRNPIVFYEGHLPAFSLIAFLNRGLGREGVDPRLEQLFARGIDPESEDDAAPRSGASTVWPARRRSSPFAGAADALVDDAIRNAPFDESRPAMRRAKGSTLRSNTKRCTRRRCSTCGIVCRTS